MITRVDEKAKLIYCQDNMDWEWVDISKINSDTQILEIYMYSDENLRLVESANEMLRNQRSKIKETK